jgi:transaldolase
MTYTGMSLIARPGAGARTGVIRPRAAASIRSCSSWSGAPARRYWRSARPNSRVDTEVDARPDKISTPAVAALRGRAAIANARLAYQHYERMLASPRWAALAAAGARPQRPLWASTSVKDPAYPDTRYVTDLVAPGVVNTMPEATLRAVADHGRIPEDSVRGHYAEARQVLSDLEALGIDYGDATDKLGSNGLAAFDASWRELGGQLRTALRRRPGGKESAE